MKKKCVRLCAVLMAFVMLMALVTACGSTKGGENTKAAEITQAASQQESSTAVPAIDTSKKVDLIIYMLGPAPKEGAAVLAEFNKMTEKDLNCTVTINNTTWDDWPTKYNLLLTSGEPIDLISTDSWSGYSNYAKKGAFVALDELLPQYAPLSWNSISKQGWSDSTIDGKIYMVPFDIKQYNPNNFLYREDLRKKYNVPEFTSLESIGQYFDAIKKNEPNMTPIDGTVYWDLYQFFIYSSKFVTLPNSGDLIAMTSYDTPRDLVYLPETPEFEQFAKLMRDWANKGYWPKNVLSTKVAERDAFENGLISGFSHNYGTASGVYNDIIKTHPDWELGYFVLTDINKNVQPGVLSGDGISVPKSAKNPERALMLLDKIKNDQTYYDAIQYGIKGKHYDLTADGKWKQPDGVDAANIGFGQEGFCSWGWRSQTLMRKTDGGWSKVDDIINNFESYAKPNLYGACPLSFDNVQAEWTALGQVNTEYFYPLCAGLIDPVSGLNTLKEKDKAAGLDKVMEDIKKQFNAYLDEKGIK